MQLNFKKFGEGFPVVILHGVLGSLDNWQTIARKMADLSAPATPLAIYIVDQRNHGKSPHTDEFSYQLLVDDLLEFLDQNQITKAHLIGHSMGGKTVMKFALEHAERVSKLVVVDIAPAGYSMQNAEVFSALQAVDVAHASSRSEVEDALRSKLSGDESTIQFLMKGLIRDNEGIHFEWKFNLHSLVNNLAEISGNIDAAKPYYGPALFIKGQYSKYINAENYPVIEHLFPNNSLSEIKRAGHWVHADNPQDFINEVLTFLL